MGINTARSCVDPAVRFLLAITLAGCSSGKPKHVEDAHRPPEGSGSAAPSADAAPVEPPPVKQTTGDVQIRVEWPAMPLAARVSPGASACKTPLAAQVAPTTTWGIPEVVVFVDGASAVAADVRVAVDRCAVTPRIAIGSHLAIASAADQPLKATLTKKFAALDPKHGLKTQAVPIALPIVGHEVTTDLDDNGIYRVAPEGKDVDDGYIVGATAFITDLTGVALIKDVPPGKHTVHVWLPPRGGQPAREAKGEVTVEVGDLAELTLTLE